MNKYEDVLEIVKLYGGILEIIGDEQAKEVLNFMYRSKCELFVISISNNDIKYMWRNSKWLEIDEADGYELAKVKIIKEMYLDKITHSGIHVVYIEDKNG